MKGYYWGEGNAARTEAAEVAAKHEITEAQQDYAAEAAKARARNAEMDKLSEAVIRLDDLLDAEMDFFAGLDRA